jgi:hypothetical protein
MAELFVDASGRKPKCYWKDHSCPNGKWYRIKTGPDTLFIVILLLQLVIGFLFWMFLGAKLLWVTPVTIVFMIFHCFLYPHSEVDTILEKSKKIEDILIENSPIYISVSKALGCIYFIIPEKKHMFFTTLRYTDSRLNSTSAGWYTFKNNKPLEIKNKYFQEPIEDLKSKLDYRCDLSSIVKLSDSRSNMKKALKSMQDVSFAVFGE